MSHCIGSLIWGYQYFYSFILKNGFGAKKRPNLAQNWHFWPNMGIFLPIWVNAPPKHNSNKLPRWFLLYGYQNFYFLPLKLGFLAHKRQNWPKIDSFWPNISNFGPLNPMPDPKKIPTSCLGGFFVMWVPKLLPPPVRIRIFGPKTAKIGPKYAFLVLVFMLRGYQNFCLLQ